MLRSYLKLAWKVLWRRKFFTAISLFGICLTLVVLMVATAVLDHIFAPLAPEVRQHRTLSVLRARMTGEHVQSTSMPGYLLLDRYARDLPGVERTAIFAMPRTVYSYWNGQRIRSLIKRTDAEYWRVLDFRFLEGGRSPIRTLPGASWWRSSTPRRGTASSAARPPSAVRSKPTASTSASSASSRTFRSCGSWRTATSTSRSPPPRPTLTAPNCSGIRRPFARAKPG